jgi:hypothetical protein
VKLDPKIDALFQLPLEQFTQKRNALAKELAGESKKQIKFLTKPPLPIWAVNQLYWRDRPTYNALVDASEKLRTAHRAALSGQKADIRKVELVHRAALDKAVSKAIALVEQSQGNISDPARDTIRKALAALPTDEAPGRMTHAPEAAGFSLLTGIKISAEGARGGKDAPGLPHRSAAAAKAGARGVLEGAGAAAKAETAALRRAEAAAAAKAAALEKQIAEAERALQRARKAAEQAKFQVRKRQTDLEKAQAAEERLAADAAVAQRKLDELRRR